MMWRVGDHLSVVNWSIVMCPSVRVMVIRAVVRAMVIRVMVIRVMVIRAVVRAMVIRVMMIHAMMRTVLAVQLLRRVPVGDHHIRTESRVRTRNQARTHTESHHTHTESHRTHAATHLPHTTHPRPAPANPPTRQQRLRSRSCSRPSPTRHAREASTSRRSSWRVCSATPTTSRRPSTSGRRGRRCASR